MHHCITSNSTPSTAINTTPKPTTNGSTTMTTPTTWLHFRHQCTSTKAASASLRTGAKAEHQRQARQGAAPAHAQKPDTHGPKAESTLFEAPWWYEVAWDCCASLYHESTTQIELAVPYFTSFVFEAEFCVFIRTLQFTERDHQK
jgi:hypothetical protein